MSRTRKRFIAAASLLVGASLVVFAAVQSSGNVFAGKANLNSYSLSFDKNTNRLFESGGTSSGTHTVLTSLGNEINFNYDLGTQISKNNWHTFLADSYFYNATPLTGLSSLTITTSTSEKMTITWSNNADFSSSSSVTLSTSQTAQTTLFGGDNPSYFKITNATTHTVYLKALTVNYTCSSDSSTSQSDSSSADSSSADSSTGSSSGENSSSTTTLSKTELAYTVDDYVDNNVYTLSSCPTSGSPKLLIIPIWFSNSSSIISSSYKANVKSDIETAFLGSEEETGWHSVSSYYREESGGALNITGVVSDWYEASYTISQVGYNMDYTDTIVENAVNWYFNTYNPSANRADFDYDGDGYLDGVMAIYAAPDYQAYGNSNLSNLWAYCYWLQGSASTTNPQANAYFWASYDFLYGYSNVYTRTGNTYYNGDTRNCTIDAHTYIHEFGHVLGLNDYYDYSSNGYSPAGGFSMQDYNVGAHDPYSVMSMGWADPYIPTESCTIEIGAFQTTKDLILLTPSWNSYDSPFDEYLLLELYTPTGLNELDSAYQYDGDYPQGPSTTGIRLWHVDARLATCTAATSTNLYFSRTLTSNPIATSSEYGKYMAITNTYSYSGENLTGYLSIMGSAYYNYNELQLIRNSTSATYRPSDYLSSSSLFTDGDTFSMSTYSRQFVNSTNLNSESALGWNFSVSISGSGANATASITCTKA